MSKKPGQNADGTLQKNEELYRTIFEHTATANMIVAEDTTILMANSNFEALTGYTRRELEHKMSWTVLVAADDLDAMKERHRLRRIDPGLAPNTYEFKGIMRSGEVRHLYMSVAMIPETKNSIISIIDMTHHLRQEEALRKSQAQLSSFLNFVPSFILIKDHEFRPVYANDKFASMFPFDDWKGKKPDETFPPDVAAAMIEKDRDAMEKGFVRYEETWTDAMGQHHIFETDKFRIMVPGANPLLGAIITDITDRKMAQEALRQSEERFRDMARLLPETVFETDLRGNLTFVNEAALAQFGYSLDDIERGLSFLDVVAPQERERALANFLKIAQGEHLGLSEYLARKKDGTTFAVLIHTARILKDGILSGSRGFVIDISEKKALQEQLLRAQKMEAIGTLAGGIAHDFNNLLMGILGNISLMLMESDETNSFYERLKSMEEYVRRGSDLTRQLLGFARGGKYEVRTTNLGKFVLKSAEMFGRTKKEIHIHHKTQDNLWYVDLDLGQMDQVLLNLFVNAWQAMPGGGELYLSVENVQLDKQDVLLVDVHPGRFVKLTVADTGVGMDAATQARIFEPFFSTKERGRGTGLGLASVYGIIKNHGGFIRVESEKGAGTSFMIYLPASNRAVEEETRRDNNIQKGKETILFIDDEEMIVDVGRQVLEGLGYKVLPAVGGREGLSIFEQNEKRIDLVILDMVMPGLNGKETFDALRRLKPSVKVLLSSGYSLDSQAEEIMAKGCRGFIQKPFSTAELSAKVREVLASD